MTNAAFCSECGAALAASGGAYQEAVAPAQPQQAPPQPVPLPQPVPATVPAAAPAYQPPMAYRTPTVKYVNLGDILFIISGVLLIAAGFDNLGGWALQHLLLGIIAIVGGLFFLALVITPHLLRELSKMSGMLTIISGLVFLVWGMAAAFGGNVGLSGGLLVSAGLAALLSSMLREGMIR